MQKSVRNERPEASQPVISVVIEGFNESREQGTADRTVEALRAQDYPLNRVELILVGSSEQVEEWRALLESPAPFHAVRTIAAGGDLYYALKNKGSLAATGRIIAFTDSDVYPVKTWLSAIVDTIEGGADVSVGLTLFKDAGSWRGTSLLRQMAVSCTFGYILGPVADGRRVVRGFMDHNVALRAEVFRGANYRTEFGRVIASPLLFRRLEGEGRRIGFSSKQAVAHYFAWKYWLRNILFRYGFEVYRLRRVDPKYPNQWIRRFGPLEPVATLFWHMALDVPRWLRFSREWGLAAPVAVLCLPALVVVSGVGRVMEMAGMYATMCAPEAMARWASTV
jgi:glycosyltransferase involved in cell wall biosynthesis